MKRGDLVFAKKSFKIGKDVVEQAEVGTVLDADHKLHTWIDVLFIGHTITSTLDYDWVAPVPKGKYREMMKRYDF